MITLKDFEDTGALLKGHFRLSSGLHSDTYLQCARLLQWPARAEAAGRELAPRLAGFAPRVIVSPDPNSYLDPILRALEKVGSPGWIALRPGVYRGPIELDGRDITGVGAFA